jgi:hypothetical protein
MGEIKPDGGAAQRRLPVLHPTLQGGTTGVIGAGFALRPQLAGVCHLPALLSCDLVRAAVAADVRPCLARVAIGEGGLVNILDDSRSA